MKNSNDLTTAILNGIRQALANTHTNLIAKVIKVNDKTIDVQPVIARVVNGEEIPLPVFTEVPIINFLGGNSSIQMPISVGDYCMLLVSERCFDDWYFGSDNKAPLIKRMHDYSDSVALVGLHNKNGELSIPKITTIKGDLQHDGDLVHNGNTEQKGDLKQTGNIDLIGDIKQTGNTNITINLIVGGVVTAGSIVAGGLTVAPSGGSSGKAEIKGDLNIKGGKLLIDGVDVLQRLNNHTHTAPNGGGITSVPN